MYKRIPLSVRIFLVIIGSVITTMLAMAAVTFYQYGKIAKEYNDNRLDRKEQIIIETFDYILSKRNSTEKDINTRIGSSVYEVSDINNLDINFYTLDGKYIIGNKIPDIHNKFIPKEILKDLSVHNDRIEVVSENYQTKKDTYTSIYRYIYNNDYQPVAIINLSYRHDDPFMRQDFYGLVFRYLAVMFVILFLSAGVAWIFSQTLMKKIKTIAYRLGDTGALSGNRPILYNYVDEISPLVKAYNAMLVKFREQTEVLVKAEKDSAWQEMAKQVAHEIKNPLTPMKLEIQSFQMRFDRQDPNIKEKLNNLTRSLSQQIDTISAIAEAFSDFAKMPMRKDQKINVIEAVKNTVEIYPQEYIKLDYQETDIILNLDINLLNRVITNLIKNALQSIPERKTPEIIIKIRQDMKTVHFSVIDNGAGIPKEIQSKIFTPQFSTKTSGSGLGLAISKKIIEEYDGKINFYSEEGKGTIFLFEIPKNA
ncbi:MAG: GHKL domain-containing protein [Flavobacteriaceae bacterium]|jgi:nitrogen fixation/metabolism regulation signal transduction histidine kinase|nr:GHKL domain-containing protein [Flavobacteriaceae bacterium]